LARDDSFGSCVGMKRKKVRYEGGREAV